MENREGKDDEVHRRVWKTVETKAEKTRVKKTKKQKKKMKWEEKKQKKEEKNKRKKKPKKERTIEVKKIVKEWEIWDEKEEIVKLEKEAKRLVPKRFISRFISLAEKLVKGCLQGSYRIVLLRPRRNLY